MNIDGLNARIQKIKDTNYVYEDIPYWDKSKKQNRHRRIYIGKLDAGGDFVPNKKYLARQSDLEKEKGSGVGSRLTARTYFGATHMLDEIGKLIGVEADLKASFPGNYKELMSLAYYLILESDSPMYRFTRWSHDHRHPSGSEISSQRISEIMRGVSEEGKLRFFKRQAGRRQEKEYLAYDTTSVSSWSEYIKAVRYGKNKDGDELPQVNMALVFGEESSLPVYYRILPGNISDVSAVKKLLKDVEFLEIDKLKLVMDRGFYSASNINALYKGHYKFLIAVRAGNAFVSEVLADAKKTIRAFGNYDELHDLYRYSVPSKWSFTQTSGQEKAPVSEPRRIYIHVYYNGIRAEEEKRRFIRKLAAAKAAIMAGDDLSESQKSLCAKYFKVSRTPKRGVTVEHDEKAVSKHMDDAGYFVLLSNDIKDPVAAIETYRKKDMVEKAFDNLKERLEMRRTAVHSDETLQGRFFLQFLALIYVSYIHKHMSTAGLYRNYTIQTLLDSLDVIERFDYAGQKSHCGEITQKQRDLFEALGTVPPTNTL
jgi:transposase